MDRIEAEAALQRAVELDALAENTEPVFDRATLQRVADELGLTRPTVDRAVAEVLDVAPGPLNAAATRIIEGPVDEVESAVESMLRLRGLTTDGGMVWQQSTGWWPDLFRFRSVTALAVTLMALGMGTTVRFTARLDRIWRTHLLAAVAMPLLALLPLGPAELVPWLALSAGWIVLCGAAYLYRRDTIQRRLEQALVELSTPHYRLHPW